MQNIEVLRSFLAGQPGRSRTLFTDGRLLKSYDTPLAYRYTGLNSGVPSVCFDMIQIPILPTRTTRRHARILRTLIGSLTTYSYNESSERRSE